MKRSEVEKTIEEILKASVFEYVLFPDGDNTNKIMDTTLSMHILDELIKLGMLPPQFYDNEECNFMTVPEVLDCGNLDGTFRWEDEDEKK